MKRRRSIVFRVDSGKLIGSGHLMRSLTLADELHRRGHEVSFICRPIADSLHAKVGERGYKLSLLPAADRNNKPVRLPGMIHWDFAAVSQAEDARQTSRLLQPPLDPLVVVDHYGLGFEWDQIIRGMNNASIIAIDDLADRNHDCDLILDQNYYKGFEARYENLVSPRCNKLLGPNYALIRPEFTQLRQYVSKIPDNTTNKRHIKILVSFGANDYSGYGLDVASSLLKETSGSIALMGRFPGEASEARIHELTAQFEHRFEAFGFCANPWDLMKDCDIFVGAGGSTTWERCALGLPGIIYAISENQIAMSRDLAELGCQVFMGPIAEFESHRLIHTVQNLIDKPDRITKMSNIALELVDAKGLTRVASAIETTLLV